MTDREPLFNGSPSSGCSFRTNFCNVEYKRWDGKDVIDARAQQEIEALVIEHAWLQDNNAEAERLADLYTEDGRLFGIEPERRGRTALLEYGRSRIKLTGLLARHVCSNLRLVPLQDGRIKGQSIITLFRHVGDGVGPADPCAVADANDIYEKDADGRWKIAERRLELVFESASHRQK